MVESKAPAAIKAPVAKEVDPRSVIKRVIVNRLNVAEGNQDLEIVVNDLGVQNGRASFFPGQEIDLTMAQVNILNSAVERTRIDIPAGSGIYNADSPVQMARQQNPGFSAHKDLRTGMIYVERLRPNYSISEVNSLL